MEQAIDIAIRKGTIPEVPQLVELHRTVSEVPGALIRDKAEISLSYMEKVVGQCVKNGLILVAYTGDHLIGAIHAHTPDVFAFSHLLTELSIVVHPAHQGKGIGRRLFESFLRIVQEDFPHILRVELFTREHSEKNVSFYTSLGFRNEGRQENKIKLRDRTFHTPIHMAWINPNYQKR